MQETPSSLPLVPVILSGGSGTRLWPMSRQLYPKQFIPLIGGQSLFQKTLERVAGLPGRESPITVCNEEHRFMAAEQLRRAGEDGALIMLEPAGRNTAPAIAVAALEVLERHGDGVMLVLPADHIVNDRAAFHSAAIFGMKAAISAKLVTFGIVPDRPETGYGYIHEGDRLDIAGAQETVHEVEAFVEKPDQQTARRYLDEGGYLWNSGMFMFLASRYLKELSVHAPGIFEACSTAHQRRSRDLDFVRLEKAAFLESPSDSIDYAVMEKTEHAVVIPLDAGWNDVGSWHSLWEAEEHDEHENILIGDVIAEDCKGCYIHAGRRLVGAVGVSDLVIVETADAVLVVPRERSQEVRAIVDRLNNEGRGEAQLHRKVYRPWGSYESIDMEERFQAKRISVDPGHSLSLQMHHHRAEHWIVVKGTARVTRDNEVVLLSENESTYIPVGCNHRLENPGRIPLELIEVQSGSYLGEDDIVRFEDNYGR